MKPRPIGKLSEPFTTITGFPPFLTFRPTQKGPGFFKNLGGHFRVNSYLPSMERSSILSMEKFEFSTKEKAWEGLPVLVLPEIVCVDGIPHNDCDDNFDLAFHARYCKAIGKYYFGTLPFPFQQRPGWSRPRQHSHGHVLLQ